MEPGTKRDALLLGAGIAAGIIIAAAVFALTGGGDRYGLVASRDGAVVHRIDKRTGRVWWKSSYVEPGAGGQPVTIWYWEELTLDGPGAKEAAGALRDSGLEAGEAERAARSAEARRLAELRDARLDEILSICGDDSDCAAGKCASGYKGAADPEWTSYCTEELRGRSADLVIDRCRGSAGCIKSYCINKFHNTYPAVSDCVSEINLRKVRQETAGQESPDGADAEQPAP